MTVHLQYIGRLLVNDVSSPRLWNIITVDHPRFRATLGIEGLKELGVIQ